MEDREKIEELQRAVCAYNTGFYSTVNILVEISADMQFSNFCSILLQHHRKDKMIKFASDKFRRIYNQNNNNNKNNYPNRNNNSDNSNNIHNQQSQNPKNGEANLSQAGKGRKAGIKCWDCGKDNVKVGHPDCPDPGSKKFKPKKTQNNNNNNNNHRSEANHVANNPIIDIQKKFEKLSKELNDKVDNIHNTVTAYSTSIEPLTKHENDYLSRESILDEFLNHENNCCDRKPFDLSSLQIATHTESIFTTTSDSTTSNTDSSNTSAASSYCNDAHLFIDVMLVNNTASFQNGDDLFSTTTIIHSCCTPAYAINIQVNECNMINRNWRDLIPDSEKLQFDVQSAKTRNLVKQQQSSGSFLNHRHLLSSSTTTNSSAMVLTPNAADLELLKSSNKGFDSLRPPGVNLTNDPDFESEQQDKIVSKKPFLARNPLTATTTAIKGNKEVIKAGFANLKERYRQSSITYATNLLKIK
jgi:hypothetical protein